MRKFGEWFRRPASPPVLDASDVAGHVDSVENGVVRGWAARLSRPRERVSVEVRVDGRAVARDVAALFRDDLDAAGWGDGRHGFEIRLPDALIDGADHRLDVVEATTSTPIMSHTARRRLGRLPSDQPGCADVLFDAGYYRRQSSIIHSGLDHYRKEGWRAGFDPHPLFSTGHYLSVWPGAAETDPLTHFESIGQFSDQSTHPLFDPALFRAQVPAVAGRSRHPVLEYVLSAPEERPPDVSRFFSETHYGTQVDPGETDATPLLHYLTVGFREGRSPAPGFDPRLFRHLTDLSGRIEPFTYFLGSLRDGTERARNSVDPRISVIIPSYNKALLTLQCLFHLRRAADMSRTEIIVVDNGSGDEDFQLLDRHGQGASIIRLNRNRGFGEGCNIGAEHARGDYLFFLNNDAFVTSGAIEALARTLTDDPTIGAAGPKILSPDGTLQEAGALVSSCGACVQRGRGLSPDIPSLNRMQAVDYCSGAALMVRASSFREVLGFDPCWDPAYYEDSDLCLKLRVGGKRTVYVPDATIIHLEHATSADSSLGLRLGDIVEVNRLKFVGRWIDHLSGEKTLPPDAFVAAPPPPPRAEAPRLGLFTPYPLVPGGGERYLLTMIEALADHEAVLQTPARYSRLRLVAVGRELGLDLRHATVEPHADSLLHGAFDVFVCMGNHLMPPVPAYGQRSFYHCQFPFPMSAHEAVARGRHLGTYEAVLVNSRYSAEALKREALAYGVALPPVRILWPAVPQIGTGPRSGADPLVILSVGRFSPGGHCKRQDVMVAEFRRLLARGSRGIQLHLAGNVGPDAEARQYLRQLVADARDLPVRFHVNPTPHQIVSLYRMATLYWHATGAGADLKAQPERAEHFGIAIVEAMSAGIVPIVLRAGGPTEVITDGHDGFFIEDASDLPARTAWLLDRPDLLAATALRAIARARDFSPARFAHRLRRIVSGEPQAEGLALAAE